MADDMREQVLMQVFGEAEHTVEDLRESLTFDGWGLADLADMCKTIRTALNRLEELDGIAHAFDDAFDRFCNL